VGEIFERPLPTTPLEWTGERLTTDTFGQVEIEHLHRYFLARDLCRGLDVLDVASGEGYGSALLAQSARSVVGVELSERSVAHAATSYNAPNLRFLQGDARELPIGDASVDAVVSFETLEHFFEHDRFIAEVQRVLRPAGRLILSSPERDVYSPAASTANPYHVRELSRGELETLLRPSFPHLHVLSQRPMVGSVMISHSDVGPTCALTFERRGPRHFEASRGLPRSPYVIVIASQQPLSPIPISLFIETSEVGSLLSQAAASAALVSAHEQLASAHEELASAHEELAQAREAEAKAAADTASLAELREDLARTNGELDDLKDQLETILQRSWILKLARVTSPSFRRFVLSMRKRY
jgi:SAM-dependent methyltransferase